MPYSVGVQGVCASLVGLYKPEEYGMDRRWEPLVRFGLMDVVDMREAWREIHENE